MINNGISKYTTTLNIILIMGGLAIAYFGVVNPLLKFTGVKKSEKDKEKDKEDKEKDKVKQGDVSDIIKTGIKPTYNSTNYVEFADIIWNKRKYNLAFDNDEQAAVDILKKMRNDLDVALLLKAYGLRRDYFFGIETGQAMGLFTAVREKVPASLIEQVNTEWAKRGITYRV